MFYLKDTRGNPSVTLTLVFITWLVITIKFFTGGIDGMEYATILGTALFSWVGREYTEKVKK